MFGQTSGQKANKEKAPNFGAFFAPNRNKNVDIERRGVYNIDIERSDYVQVKSDIIQGVINRAKTAVRNFGENAKIELPAELVKNICQNLNAERYRLAKLNKKYSALKQQVKSEMKK